MHHQARLKLLNRFDTRQYDRNELVVLSIPLNLPYPVETSEPERVDVKFDYDNETYRLVQRRFENDTIFLVCIRDLESTRISNNLTEYINLTQELPGSNKEAISFLSKLNKDFTKTLNIAFPTLIGLQQTQTPHVEFILNSSDRPIESPPPDLLS
jgi:hypothetical protein